MTMTSNWQDILPVAWFLSVSKVQSSEPTIEKGAIMLINQLIDDKLSCIYSIYSDCFIGCTACCFARVRWYLSNFLLRFLPHFAISSSVGEESVCSDHLSTVFSDTAPENIKPESNKKVKCMCINVTQAYIIYLTVHAGGNIAYE